MPSKHKSTRPRRSSADNDLTLINPDDTNSDEWTDEEPAADQDTYFYWEDEATLFSDLLEEATPEADDAKLNALAESIQEPFDHESRQLKKEIARAFVPLVNNVKQVYSSIDRTVDIPFGAGLLAINEACKNMEKSISAGSNIMQAAHVEHEKQVSELLQQVEDAYRHREQLWADFQHKMDEIVNPVLEMLHEAPAQMERTIASIEKQSKTLEKENASAPAEATAQALKEILSKLK